jgi:hypothetical protein
MPFAADTEVPVDRTRREIDALLVKHGAAQRGFFDDDASGRAVVFFSMGGRQIRLTVPLPKPSDFPDPKLHWMDAAEHGKELPHGWKSMPHTRRAAWVQSKIDQVARSRWRALLLITKAKLELIELGMSSVEREFLADVVLPNGQLVGEAMRVALEEAYASGSMPPLLGPGGA